MKLLAIVAGVGLFLLLLVAPKTFQTVSAPRLFAPNSPSAQVSEGESTSPAPSVVANAPAPTPTPIVEQTQAPAPARTYAPAPLPMARISGTAASPSGDVLPGITVVVYRFDDGARVTSSVTNAYGFYSVRVPTQNTYKVCFSSPTVFPKCYINASEAADANPVHVVNSDVSGVNALITKR